MALTKAVAATVQARTLRGDDIDAVQVAEVVFFHDPTTAYAQATHGQIDAVPTIIQNSRRNGKTVTMRAVMAGQSGSVTSTGAALYLASVAISSANVTYTITTDWSTEIPDATPVGAQSRPMSILVTFTEA